MMSDKMMFRNPIYAGQDPFVCKGDDGFYYFVCESMGAQAIDIYRSPRLTDRGVKRTVFKTFREGRSSADLWAPELWHLNGKWYVYYAGATAIGDWDTHRMFVLEADEPWGPYSFAGELELGERMSIDGTVMQLPDGRMYLFYMGRNDEKTLNCLYMAELETPTKVKGEPVCLTKPELPWESDITEGPFPILKNGHVNLMYSANAAHLPEYSIGMMKCRDPENLMDPASWEKLPEPVFRMNGNYSGPGHACITASPDGSEEWLMFHSKFTKDCTLPGGWDRAVNILPASFDEEGILRVGEADEKLIRVPSGEKPYPRGEDLKLELKDCAGLFADLCYSRSEAFYQTGEALIIDGSRGTKYGNKVLLREKTYADFLLTVDFRPETGTENAGVLFRAAHPAVGPYAWEGYGLMKSAAGKWKLIRTDGGPVTVLAEGSAAPDAQMKIVLKGDRITVLPGTEPSVTVKDVHYTEGLVGLTSVDGPAAFYKLEITV